MSNTIEFNQAKGRIARYADLSVAGSKLVWVLLKSAGLVDDATMKDYDTLSQILAGASDEATFTGYARHDATSVVVSVNDTPDTVTIDADDPTWSPSGTSESLGAIVLCYDPDGSHNAATMVPLFKDDFILMTPGTGAITYVVASGGFATVS